MCWYTRSNAHQVPQPVSVFYVLLDTSITTERESILIEHETVLMSGHLLGTLAGKDFEEIKALG